MKTVCIVVGHKVYKGGAVNEALQVSEYDYNQLVAMTMAAELHRDGIRPVILYRDSYSKLPADINRIAPDYCVELHCNASADRSVQGTATLCWHNSAKGRALAQRCQKAMVKLFGDNDRGVKLLKADDRGALMVRDTKMPTILLEPFFISNDDSLAKGFVLREQYAEVVARAIAGYIKEGN